MTRKRDRLIDAALIIIGYTGLIVVLSLFGITGICLLNEQLGAPACQLL